MQVENQVLSKIFNTFDWAIRFIYSHFSPIRKLMYKNLYSSDYHALDRKFEYFKKLFDTHNIEISDKVILEIGPGNSLIMAYNMLSYGAKKIILVDKYPLNAFAKSGKGETFKTAELQSDYFKAEQNFMRKKIGNEQAENLFNRIETENLIEYIAADLSEINDCEPVDTIISNSVFEHIKNPEDTIEASANILVTGGHALHSIDLRDHYNFKAPFLFYKYSEKVWNKYMTKLGVSYTNRLRAGDFENLFKHNNFNTLHEHKISQNKIPKKINSHFKDRTDLHISHIDLLVQNNKTASR